MIYPKEVQEELKILDDYKYSDKLSKFNIFHLYPKELAYPNGYYDSRFFELIGFNTNTMEKCNLRRHDSIEFCNNSPIAFARVFADGSFLIRMRSFVENIANTQAIYMQPIDKAIIKKEVKLCQKQLLN